MNLLKHSRYTSAAAALLLALATVACSDDDDPTGPTTGDFQTLTVDASAGWAYVNLESNSVVSVAEPTASTAWDIAFNATAVMLNGGAAGPGGVSGACDCGTYTLADVENLTAASELPRFEAASAATIPPASEFLTDELSPAIQDWYAGSAGPSATPNAERTFIIRRSEPAVRFAKLRVTAIAGATASSPGQVTLEYATQPEAGGEFATAETRTVTVGEGTAYVDLFNGGGDASSWDLSFDGWTVRVNGGVSGSGVAALALDAPFASVDVTTAATIPSTIYPGDQYAGIFAEHPWQVYSGPPLHQVFPTFDVYYVKRGDAVYKLQITSYYATNGDARHISMRSQRL